MGEPLVGEIRMFAGSFAPAGWAFCDGTPMPISENETLFTLLGTTYGGDGQETFNLPNLQSRFPVHAGVGPDGATYTLGEMAGVEEVTLTVNQIPIHTHPPLGHNAAGTLSSPLDAVWSGAGTGEQIFNTPPTVPAGSLHAASVGATGGSQPHENMPPFLCISFIISLFGVFPN
jgi:microcystin-dependent protein